jgi:hypothetical protein
MAQGRDVWQNETAPVGSFPPNAFGLYDMFGNAFEWIEDCIRLRECNAAVDENRNLSIRTDVQEIALPLITGLAEIHRPILMGDAKHVQRQLHLVRVAGLATTVQDRDINVAHASYLSMPVPGVWPILIDSVRFRGGRDLQASMPNGSKRPQAAHRRLSTLLGRKPSVDHDSAAGHERRAIGA